MSGTPIDMPVSPRQHTAKCTRCVRMPAELVTQGRDRLRAEAVRLTRSEPHQEGERHERGRARPWRWPRAPSTVPRPNPRHSRSRSDRCAGIRRTIWLIRTASSTSALTSFAGDLSRTRYLTGEIDAYAVPRRRTRSAPWRRTSAVRPETAVHHPQTVQPTPQHSWESPMGALPPTA